MISIEIFPCMKVRTALLELARIQSLAQARFMLPSVAHYFMACFSGFMPMLNYLIVVLTVRNQPNKLVTQLAMTCKATQRMSYR